jgi:hypothetical protein
MEYTTDDFLRAAALMCFCHVMPTKMFLTEELIGASRTPKIKMTFEVPGEVVAQMNMRKLSVEPIAYGLTLKRLKIDAWQLTEKNKGNIYEPENQTEKN